MKNRLEILKIRLEQLEGDANKLDTRTHKLRIRKQDEQKRMLSSYFSVSDEKFVCNANSDTRVGLYYDGDSYGTIVSYELQDRWSRDEMTDRVETSKIYHNGSTYENIDESMLDQSQARFEFMQCAVDHNDDIIAAWNVIEKKYDKLISSFSEARSAIRQSMNEQSRDIDKLEKEALTEKLTSKGFKFVKSEDGQWRSGRLPELEVRYDWTISRIKSLKVLRMSASGKSADLEITQMSNRWDEASKSYIDSDVVDTYKTVRMEKVESLIRSAKVNKQLVD